MADEHAKPSQADATPEAGSPAPKPQDPGHPPKAAETEARPDTPVPNDDAGA